MNPFFKESFYTLLRMPKCFLRRGKFTLEIVLKILANYVIATSFTSYSYLIGQYFGRLATKSRDLGTAGSISKQ